MKSRIYKELLRRGKKNKALGYFDLDMANGDELTVYLEGRKITRDYSAKDYSVLTDDNKVLCFETLADIAGWIEEHYC